MSTRTRSFGSSSRESHDSSSFYNRRLYGSVQEVDLRDEDLNEVPGQYLNQVLRGDSRDLSFIPDNSTQLMITSPPYNVGKDYDEDLSLEEYLELIHDVMKEIHRILIPGGRACINVANVGRKPYLPLNHLINQIMLELGFFMRGEIIWDKGASAGSSCAWGSWQSPSNPVLRDVHEYIMIYTKACFGRKDSVSEDRASTITRDEFLEYTKSIWTFTAESARRVKHPAPFPVELPYRLIQLYSYSDDIIVDPFCGSGTTCLAALQTGRRFIGVDIDERYVEVAIQRIAASREK
ncbi:MAG TPA: site-specific DNA-methyltransferase [Firmicutes bacterium]|nr:site-specific DNA-methyltransferase [Bacillota bacterium]